MQRYINQLIRQNLLYPKWRILRRVWINWHTCRDRDPFLDLVENTGDFWTKSSSSMRWRWVSLGIGILRPAANPGTRVFGRFCWDLDEQGATDAILRLTANPGTRVFSEKCWYLDTIAKTLTRVTLAMTRCRAVRGTSHRRRFEKLMLGWVKS